MKILAYPGWKNKDTNPYNALLCTSLQSLGVNVTEYERRQVLSPKHFNILHVHWPDGIFRDISKKEQIYHIILFFYEMIMAKFWRIRIIWTVHNLRPHCRRNESMEALFYTIWLYLVDGLIFLSHHSKVACWERYPQSLSKPCSVIPHGHYRDLISKQRTPDEARKLLGLSLEKRYLVFIGQIRPYKNIPHLIECFKSANIDKSMLVIAGVPANNDLAQQLAELAEKEPRIVLNFGLLSAEQLEIYTQSADLVVLPYKSVLNSGSIIYALSCNKKVLVPNSETFCELQSLIKTKHILMYEGELRPEDLNDSIRIAQTTDEVNLDALNWEDIGRAHVDFFNSVMDAKINLRVRDETNLRANGLSKSEANS